MRMKIIKEYRKLTDQLGSLSTGNVDFESKSGSNRELLVITIDHINNKCYAISLTDGNHYKARAKNEIAKYQIPL